MDRLVKAETCMWVKQMGTSEKRMLVIIPFLNSIHVINIFLILIFALFFSTIVTLG